MLLLLSLFSHSVMSDSFRPHGLYSTTGFPVLHRLPELAQTHVHWVGDAIQPFHPLSSPSPPAPNPSQHQGLFYRSRSSHQVAEVLELHFQAVFPTLVSFTIPYTLWLLPFFLKYVLTFMQVSPSRAGQQLVWSFWNYVQNRRGILILKGADGEMSPPAVSPSHHYPWKREKRTPGSFHLCVRLSEETLRAEGRGEEDNTHQVFPIQQALCQTLCINYFL